VDRGCTNNLLTYIKVLNRPELYETNKMVLGWFFATKVMQLRTGNYEIGSLDWPVLTWFWGTLFLP
jgi:hypothetical protein